MAIPKQYTITELTDGTLIGPTRITLADKLAWEKTARHQGWNVENNAVTMNAFLAWAAAKRTGAFTGSFDEYMDQAVDVAITDGDDMDPTQPAA